MSLSPATYLAIVLGNNTHHSRRHSAHPAPPEGARTVVCVVARFDSERRPHCRQQGVCEQVTAFAIEPCNLVCSRMRLGHVTAGRCQGAGGVERVRGRHCHFARRARRLGVFGAGEGSETNRLPIRQKASDLGRPLIASSALRPLICCRLRRELADGGGDGAGRPGAVPWGGWAQADDT